eukprot:TRINITY_DN80407_c0_g1_i1.p1 TRINITY_DN80407_c0_g1~~TRINITY_DN80407_c0_g1_i1.p1  ORF type:complete len:898 (-),score=170.51 TRINITY_DN80407_c0_g1_i1:140-2782(-)
MTSSNGTLDGSLTHAQLGLLDDLAAFSPAADVKLNFGQDGTAEDSATYEDFYKYWHVVQDMQILGEVRRRRCRWEWIEEMQKVCSSTCGELNTLFEHLEELDGQRKAIMHMTTALHERCEHMVLEQERLTSTAEAMVDRLDMFDRVADVARILDQGNAATSHPDFGTVLDQLDSSIAFLESHSDFCQAQAYLHQFEHLRDRARMAVCSALQRSLEKSTAQVDAQLKEQAHKGTVETQAFYTRFRAAALNYKPLMTLLHKRIDVHETYAAALEELEAFYVHLRMRLISSPVTVHLQTILHKDLTISQLAPATRQASTYILDISHFEKQCFEAYFELRQPQEALRTLLETVADIFYQTMRPVILECGDMDSLREMADCLQMDILEPQQQTSRSDLVPVLATVYRLHKDVQERLIYRVQTYVRDEIRLFQIKDVHLCYPNILYNNDPSAAPEDPVTGSSTQSLLPQQRGWFPTMQRTLSVLKKIYRVLEMSTFQGLAQEAVDLCIGSLKEAAQRLAQRPVKETSFGNSALVQMMDAQLFLIKHLLLLREQVAAFECDLVSSEKYFDFSNVWEALQLKLPDGLLGILKPKLQVSQVDSKKDIETELKSACEALITNLTVHITQPLAVFNAQTTDFLARQGGNRAGLKDQQFMSADTLKQIVGSYLSNVRNLVPFAAAHIRMYLSSPAAMSAGAPGSSSAEMNVHSTSSILFKPVQIRLVDTWGKLDGLLEEIQMPESEQQAIGFLKTEVVRDLVSALFNSVMELQWPQVVEMVAQVPRSVTMAEPELLPSQGKTASQPVSAAATSEEITVSSGSSAVETANQLLEPSPSNGVASSGQESPAPVPDGVQHFQMDAPDGVRHYRLDSDEAEAAGSSPVAASGATAQ